MIEMYLFVNPLHTEYWSIEPIIEKLKVEYGDLFTLTHIVTGGGNINQPYRYTPVQPFSYLIEQVCKVHNEQSWVKQSLFLPHPAFLAIKAAQCQGKQASERFLHRLQLAYFCRKKDIQNADVLEQCAKDAELDLREFKSDISSDTTKNALHADFKLANELQVSETPTIIIFSNDVEEAGIKVDSHYSYEVYANIIKKSSYRDIHQPYSPPPLEEFMKSKLLTSMPTLAMIYNKSYHAMNLELKKLMIQQKVEPVECHTEVFWKARDM